MEINVDSELTLKQISRKYAEELFFLVQSNLNNELCYWCPDLKVTYATIDSTLCHIDDAISKFNEDKTPDFLIFNNNSLTGLISLSPIDKKQKTCEIGYWLGSEHERKGLISRSFPIILTYAQQTLGLTAVELSTAAPNIRSQNLPLKFNFKKMKLIPNAETLQDGCVDHILWRNEF